MTTTINWRKWDEVKPEYDRDILMLREENDISIGQFFLCTDKSEWIQFDEGSRHAVNDIIPIKYWCYTSELHPTKKYKTVKEFFEEPISQHIKDEVNCQVKIIDTAIEFANWIHDNYIGYGSYSQPKLWYPHDTITQSYTTSELWQIFLNEKENEK